MATATPFFGGLPTDLDVKKLAERFGVPAPGTLLRHEEIAECIGAAWKSNRYRTVLNQWRRKLLKEQNLDTIVEAGEGLKILRPIERVDASEADFKSSTRKLRKAAVRVSLVDEKTLDEPGRRRRDHLREVTSRLYMQAANESKALKPPSPPPALPRRQAGLG